MLCFIIILLIILCIININLIILEHKIIDLESKIIKCKYFDNIFKNNKFVELSKENQNNVKIFLINDYYKNNLLKNNINLPEKLISEIYSNISTNSTLLYNMYNESCNFYNI
jgi:hypothetical protein